MILRAFIYFSLVIALTACGGTNSSDYTCDFDPIVFTQAVSEVRNDGKQLIWSQELADAAKLHAEDLMRTGRAEHIGSDGSLPADRAQKAGWPNRYVGENLAAGYPASSMMVALDSWVKSPGHLANIKYPGMTHVGAGCSISKDSTYVVYQVMLIGGKQ
jgi:uncharacterized protein YkwD